MLACKCERDQRIDTTRRDDATTLRTDGMNVSACCCVSRETTAEEFDICLPFYFVSSDSRERRERDKVKEMKNFTNL